MAEHQGVIVGQQGGFALDLGQRTGGYIPGEPLALQVEAFHLTGKGTCQGGIAGREQLDAAGGVCQSPQCVESRAQDEADVLLGEPLGPQIGGLVDSLQAGSGGLA